MVLLVLRNDAAFEIGNVESEAGLHTFAFLKAIYTVLVHKKQVTKLAMNRTMLLGFLQLLHWFYKSALVNGKQKC